MNFSDAIKWAGLLKTAVGMLSIAISASSENQKAAAASDKLNDVVGDITGYIKAGEAFDAAYATRVSKIADDWEAKTGPLTAQDFTDAADETHAAAQAFRDTMAARHAG